MARTFYRATAEQVTLVCEAVMAFNDGAGNDQVATFAELPTSAAEAALGFAVDLRLLSEEGGIYSSFSPLCRLFRTPQDKEKAAILRIVIESYEPFIVFREELEATNDPSVAASRTKTRLNLNDHKEDVKNGLLSLATYSGALKAVHGNTYERDHKGIAVLLDELMQGSAEQADAEHTIRSQLSKDVADKISRQHVIEPLAVGLRHALAGNGPEAVLHSGNAVDSFLTWYAGEVSANIEGATGINAKVVRLQKQERMPGKIQNVSKYLGHVRNAADHGIDPEVSESWHITSQTGRNYIFVAIGFIRAAVMFSTSKQYEI